MMTRLLLLALLACAGLVSVPAQAQGRENFSLQAAIGGSLPYARKDSFLVANISGRPKERKLSLSGSLPLSVMMRPVFDPRPQFVLNSRIRLGHIGGAPLSLSAYVSAGVLSPGEDEARPLLGFAGLRLAF